MQKDLVPLDDAGLPISFVDVRDDALSSCSATSPALVQPEPSESESHTFVAHVRKTNAFCLQCGILQASDSQLSLRFLICLCVPLRLKN